MPFHTQKTAWISKGQRHSVYRCEIFMYVCMFVCMYTCNTCTTCEYFEKYGFVMQLLKCRENMYSFVENIYIFLCTQCKYTFT